VEGKLLGNKILVASQVEEEKKKKFLIFRIKNTFNEKNSHRYLDIESLKRKMKVLNIDNNLKMLDLGKLAGKVFFFFQYTISQKQPNLS